MPSHTTTSTWQDFLKEMEELRKTFPTANAGTAPDASFGVPGFDAGKVQKEIGTAREELGTAQDELAGLRTRRYSEEYDAMGLGNIQNQIASLDTKLAEEKQRRDDSVSKTRRNPYYSAATITGESSEIERQANRTINNLIEQRNSLASQYNSAVQDIRQRIDDETADKKQEVANLQYNLDSLTGQLKDYQSALKDELSASESRERWEAEFAFKLQEAERKAQETKSGGTSPRALQKVTDAFGNVSGYFNPDTGETVYYSSQDGGGGAPQSGGVQWMSESDVRSAAKQLFEQGYQPDQVKQSLAERTVRINDSQKSPSDVVDDEWKKRSGGGGFFQSIGNFFKGLFK